MNHNGVPRVKHKSPSLSGTQITDAVPIGRTIGNAERFGRCWANPRVPGSAYGCLRHSLVLAGE